MRAVGIRMYDQFYFCSRCHAWLSKAACAHLLCPVCRQRVRTRPNSNRCRKKYIRGQGNE